MISSVFSLKLCKKEIGNKNLYSIKIESFPLRISSVNVTKSAVNCAFGHIYWRKILNEKLFFVQCCIFDICCCNWYDTWWFSKLGTYEDDFYLIRFITGWIKSLSK